MAWCRQAASHYLSQCRPIPMSPYGVTMPQWVNHYNIKTSQHWNTYQINDPLWGESTSHQWIFLTKSVTWSFVFYVLNLDKLLNKQSSCWLFSRPPHSSDILAMIVIIFSMPYFIISKDRKIIMFNAALQVVKTIQFDKCFPVCNKIITNIFFFFFLIITNITGGCFNMTLKCLIVESHRVLKLRNLCLEIPNCTEI